MTREVRTVRVCIGSAIAAMLLGCASQARPLTPEEKAQVDAQKLRLDASPERCSEALEGARAYKYGGSDALPSRRCFGARP